MLKQKLKLIFAIAVSFSLVVVSNISSIAFTNDQTPNNISEEPYFSCGFTDDFYPESFDSFNYEDNFYLEQTAFPNLTIENIPKELYSDMKLQSKNITRLSDKNANDMYSIVTVNSDDTESLYMFGIPVKYVDEFGEVRFIDNKIEATDNKKTAYRNSGNSFDVNFSKNIEDGINFKLDDYSFEMIPILNRSIKKSAPTVKNDIFKDLTEEYVEYPNVFGDGTYLRYSLQNQGIKESIILDNYNGEYKYNFTINVCGLIPNSFKGSQIEFLDEQTNETVLVLEPTFIEDSYIGDYVENEKHITYDNYYELKEISNDEYLLTMILDEKFLTDPKTVYPCLIDPSIQVIMQSSTGIESSYVQQSNNIAILNNNLNAGSFNGTGMNISYFKAPGMMFLRYINPELITESYLRVKDNSTSASTSIISCYASTITVDVNNITYSVLSNSLGAVQPNPKTFTTTGIEYLIDIKNLTKNYLKFGLGEGNQSWSYGFILKGENNQIGRTFTSTRTTDTYILLKYEVGEIEPNFGNNNVYYLKNKGSGKYLDVANGSGVSGNNVWQWDGNQSKAQRWLVKKCGDDYQIIPVLNSNLRLNAYWTNNGLTGTNIYNNTGTLSNNTNTNQVWRIVKNSDNSYRIMSNSSTHYALEIPNGNNASGINIQLNNYNGINYQKWELVKVAEYAAVVNNYYDLGYSVYYGESQTTSNSLINSYTEAAVNRFFEIFNIQMITNGQPAYWNSNIDICKGNNVTSSNINTLCKHTENHTHKSNLTSSFFKFTNPIYPPIDFFIKNVYWSGHLIQTDTNNNRSFAWMYTDVFLIERSDELNRTKNSTGILMHELCHTIGIKDHYHETVDGVCKNKSICSHCGINPRAATCIMNSSRKDISSSDILCADCYNEALTFINKYLN